MKDNAVAGDSPQAEEVRAEIGFYPVLSATTSKLNKIFRSSNQSPQDIFAIINADPLLTCGTYALYREFFPDNTEEFFGIARIITELGVNTVKNSVINAVKHILHADKKKLSRHSAFLHRSLSVAIASLLLAKQRGIDESCLQKYYCSGLMHDIGSFILSEDGGAALVQGGKDISHAKAALLAAKFWGFPPALRDAAAFNGDYKNYTGNYSDVVLHTALAVSFVNKAEAQDIFVKLKLSQSVFDGIKRAFAAELKKIETFIGMEKT
jgi:HD-like signal output (HDOD) protein